MTEPASLSTMGIHQIVLPLDGGRTVNATLTEGHPLTLIDTGLGSPESFTLLQTGLSQLGYQIEDIEQVVITHAHLDHFGAAAAIMRASGAMVVGDAGGMATMADFNREWQEAQAYRLALFTAAGAPRALLAATERWGDWYAAQGESIQLNTGLTPGDSIAMRDLKWEVVSVPGHAASSIALYEPTRGLLLSGDILLGMGATNVTLQKDGSGALPAGWVPTIVSSLQKLAALEPRHIFPGHGPPLIGSADLFEQRLNRIASRLAQVHALLKRPTTAYQVSQALYQPPVGESSLGLSQAIGYLDALEVMGEVHAEVKGGLRQYSRLS